MRNFEVGDEIAYFEWESKYMESWEYAPVGNQPQFNYDVRSSYQKIITLGEGAGEWVRVMW